MGPNSPASTFRRPPENSVSPFLRLPFEIRTSIWSYLFSDNGVTISSSQYRGHTVQSDPKSKPSYHPRAAILSTCQQLYHDARPHFYKLSRFRIKSNEPMPGRMLKEFAQFLPLSNIRHLMIGPSCRPDATLARLIRSVDQYFPNLVSLQIRVALLPPLFLKEPGRVRWAIQKHKTFSFRNSSCIDLVKAALRDRKRRPRGKCTTTLVHAYQPGEHGSHYSEWPGLVVAWIDLHEWVLRVKVWNLLFDNIDFEAVKFEAL